MRDSKNYCPKCKKFLFSTNKTGGLEIRKGLAISINLEKIDMYCNCGEKIEIKLK
uniref:Cysteine-rich protein n=1 Tax=Myoviridae sp. ctZ2t4 TaxID=2827693 RepID=A0A8S5SSN8_9CAUD|nr:MAG TPA: cysteine-rich protein [Myoviridae sp. ctZ2t4]